MGARAEAIIMFKDFRADDFFSDAFYSAGWIEAITSSGGGFGGGTVNQVEHVAEVLLMGNKDIKKVFSEGVDLSHKFIKAIIDEFGIPDIGAKVTFNESIYNVVQIKEDSVGALVSIELKL